MERRVSTRAQPLYDRASTRSGPFRAAELQRLIDSRLADCVSAVDEANAALDLLAEPDLRNAAKVIADRLLTALTSPEFDVQMRLGPDMASTRLRRLMALRVRVHASAISQDHKAQVCAALARIERAIHSDAARAALRVAGLA